MYSNRLMQILIMCFLTSNFCYPSLSGLIILISISKYVPHVPLSQTSTIRATFLHSSVTYMYFYAVLNNTSVIHVCVTVPASFVQSFPCLTSTRLCSNLPWVTITDINQIFLFTNIKTLSKILEKRTDPRLTHYHIMTTFGALEEILSLLKTLWEKKKMLVTSIFFFSHNVFYPMKDNFKILSYIQFVACKCFQLGQA